MSCVTQQQLSTQITLDMYPSVDHCWRDIGRAERRFRISALAAQPHSRDLYRFVRVRSYDRPDRSIVTVLLGTSMWSFARESWRCATRQGRSSPSIVISGPFTESLGSHSSRWLVRASAKRTTIWPGAFSRT